MNLLFLITPHTVSSDDFIAIYKLLFHWILFINFYRKEQSFFTLLAKLRGII